MVANEVEIMRDELRTRLAQQRIGLDQYLAMAQADARGAHRRAAGARRRDE